MSYDEKWTLDDIPDLTGKIAVVTGANSGIGFAATKALAQRGAHVIMGCRNLEKAKEALASILDDIPDASVEIIQLDLADLSSVRDFTQEFVNKHHSLDILLNNAGIMATPKIETVDGFELQFGTNHLGHFALTGLLMGRIMKAERSRVVTLSSDVHEKGKINFDDLQWDQSYSRTEAYYQSKLANILFAYELHRRLRAAGSNVLSICAHPGTSRTNLHSTGLKMSSGGGIRGRIATLLARMIVNVIFAIPFLLVSQSAEDGALPILYAATSPNAESGAYYGPSVQLVFEQSYPIRIESSEASHDEEVARRLWEVSSELTGVRFNI